MIDPGSPAPGLKRALWAMTFLAEEAVRHAGFKLEQVTVLPPIPDPEKILCIGLNDVTHTREGGRDLPLKPIIFTRYPNSRVGHGQDRAAEYFTHVRLWGELAMIIGRHCRHVKMQDWQSVVAGYFCYDNGLTREWQRYSSQFIPGKNFFKSGSFGPGS